MVRFIMVLSIMVFNIPVLFMVFIPSGVRRPRTICRMVLRRRLGGVLFPFRMLRMGEGARMGEGCPMLGCTDIIRTR